MSKPTLGPGEGMLGPHSQQRGSMPALYLLTWCACVGAPFSTTELPAEGTVGLGGCTFSKCIGQLPPLLGTTPGSLQPGIDGLRFLVDLGLFCLEQVFWPRASLHWALQTVPPKSRA